MRVYHPIRTLLAAARLLVVVCAAQAVIDFASDADTGALTACTYFKTPSTHEKEKLLLLTADGPEGRVLDGGGNGMGAGAVASGTGQVVDRNPGSRNRAGDSGGDDPKRPSPASNVVRGHETAAAEGTKPAASAGQGEAVSPPPPSPLAPASPPPVARKTETITFTPGLRLQGRHLYDNENDQYGFFLRRLRFKAKGDIYGVAKYGLEVKIDNVFRTGTDPKVEPENAWVEFPLRPDLALRVGLYDVPFSRNVLTSDSRQLLMDRTLITGALTNVGMADNTVGVLSHGRPFGGHLEYAAGLFNNLQFKKLGSTATTKHSNHLMEAGRIVVNFLDPAPSGGYADYQGSYLGQGRRLSVAVNSAYQHKAHDGTNEFTLYGWGTDLFFNFAGLTVEAEYDRFRENIIGVIPDTRGDGWYAQAGYLIHRRIEITGRHQELDLDASASDSRLRWTSVGLNIYLRGHSLKLQTDYTFKWRQGVAPQSNNHDMVQSQLQLDF